MSKHLSAVLLLTLTATAIRAAEVSEIRPVWSQVIGVSKTALSIQVCPEPPMRPGSPIRDRLLESLRDLRADYARLQPWYPYPKLSVAELEPPANGKTSWDFSLIDPWVTDFFKATDGHPVMLNFGTIPQWMFRTPTPVTYPEDPNEIDWNYGGGSELREATLGEVRDYYKRLASWYTKGGFEDEFGRRHESGHQFKVHYWEVLNEVDLEHNLSPQQYTRIYDAIVPALQELDPQMKFSGLALAIPSAHPEHFQYFLDPKNHKPGVPLDMISYHFYATPEPDELPEVQQHTFFAQADRFLATVRYIEAIKKQLSPKTLTYINETGSFTPDPRSLHPDIPNSYWNLSGSMFAYLYMQLAGMGIDILASGELIDYPGQFPGTTLSDWNTGQPNARYWVLKLLRDNFGPGDRLVETDGSSPFFMAQAFLTQGGSRKILIANKRDRRLEVHIPGAAGARVQYVDQTTGFHPPASTRLTEDNLALAGLAVAVLELAR